MSIYSTNFVVELEYAVDGEQSLYTVPENKVAIVRYASFYYRDAGDLPPYLSVLPFEDGGPSTIFYRGSGAPSAAEYFQWQGWVVLNSGDQLKGSVRSGGAVSVDVWVTGYLLNA